MSEHDEPVAPEETTTTSSTANLHVPKAERWKVENKIVDGEEK